MATYIKTLQDSAGNSILPRTSVDALIAGDQCFVRNSATQSVADNSWTVYAAYNTDDFDNNTMHDPSANNGKIYVKKAGLYILTATADFVSNATGARGMYVQKNRTAVQGHYIPAVSGYSTNLMVSAIARLAINDVIEVQLFQNSGGALNVSANQTLKIAMIGS